MMTPPLNRAKSIEFSIELRAQSQRCWNNALDVLLKKEPGATYVEGWICRYGQVFEHGWVEYGGEVIDTTPALLIGEEATYFPGVRYGLADVIALINRHGVVSPPFVWVAEAADEYGNAQRAACEHSQALQVRLNPA